jgi:hypothetical protein
VVKNWETEIFAYFDHRITNAFTESLNGLARVADRMGRRYSFKVLRAKILYMKGVIKMADKTQVPEKIPIPIWNIPIPEEKDLRELVFGSEVDGLTDLPASTQRPLVIRTSSLTLVVIDEYERFDPPSINQSEWLDKITSLLLSHSLKSLTISAMSPSLAGDEGCETVNS